MWLPIVFSALIVVQISRETVKRKTVSIPLSRIYKHGSYSLENIKKTMSTVKSPKNKGAVTLKDYQDTYYCGHINVGTPGQLMNVLFDTGSSDLWVASRQICTKDPQYCKHHNTYEHNKSKSYHKDGKPFSIPYEIGFANGFVSKDNLEIAGFPVKGQLFGEVTDMDPQAKNLQFNGILGMAYTSISEIEADPPFVNMVKQGVLKDPVFSFYLNRDEPSSKSNGVNASAELVFGGVDPNHFLGNITYVDVFLKSFWNIQLDSLWIGSKMIGNSIYAIPDSGTSLIIGPRLLMDPIIKAIGAKPNDDVYTVDCSTINKLPDVTFVISKVKFVLHPQEYILKMIDSDTNKTVCVSGFDTSYVGELVLGDIFMRKYYTVFYMGKNRVGYALAK